MIALHQRVDIQELTLIRDYIFTANKWYLGILHKLSMVTTVAIEEQKN